jgi:hypothetical protein
MYKGSFLVIIVFSILFVGCQGGQVATQDDSPEGGMTAPTNEAVQVIPSVSDSEIELFAIAIVNAEEEGIEPENIEDMETFLEEVELSKDRYIQIQRGMKLNADIENSVQTKIDEIRNERSEK